MIITLLNLDRLTLFGLVAVGLMLVFYAIEERSRHFTLLFAGACAMGSTYGFLQGAWPFGVVEAIWTVVALRKWDVLGRKALAARPTHEQVDRVDAFFHDLQTIAKQIAPTTFAFTDDCGQRIGFMQLYRPQPGRILIHRVWAERPGCGAGTHMLELLCELADLHSIEIALRPLPFGPEPFPLKIEQLRQWYERHGFVGTGKAMLRKPMSIEAQAATIESTAV